MELLFSFCRKQTRNILVNEIGMQAAESERERASRERGG